MNEQTTYMPDNLRLKHVTIDAQHEVLYALYNELEHTLESGSHSFEFSDIFLGLDVYVATHFQYEEELMADVHYHDIEAHCKEHETLAENVKTLYVRFTDATSKHEEILIAQEIKEFLGQWLAHHISQVDRKFVQFLTERSTS